MKVSELTPPELNLWVAKTICKDVRWDDSAMQYCATEVSAEFLFMPSTDWEDAGPLIEGRSVRLYPEGGGWRAQARGEIGYGPWGFGSTPLIAVCRAIVASVYGEEVPDAEANPP